MNTSPALTPAIDPTPPRRATWLHALRVAWLVFALLAMGIVSIGSVIRYHEQQRVCMASTPVCFEAQRLTLSKLVGITDTEKALQFHALFFLIVNGLGRIICWSIAFFLFWRRSDDWMALLIGVYLLVIGNTGPQIYAANAYPLLWPLANVLTILSNALFGLFFCIFPNGRFVPRWSRWLALLGGIYAIASPWLAFPQGPPLWFIIGFFMLYAVSVYVQVYRYRRVSTTVERQQTKWVVYGVVLWVLCSIATDLLVISGPPRDAPISPRFYVTIIGFNLTILAIPFGLSIAILRYHLFDIDFLINRTLVYSALTAFVAGAYALVVGAVGAWLRVEGNIVLSFIATGLVAVAFNPLRERLQRGVNRLMYGDRDDPYRALSRLGQRLEAAGESSAILATTVEAVAQTLKLPYVAIALKQGGGNGLQLVAAQGTESAPVTRFPLNYASELVGELTVAARAGEALNTADQRVLTDLARPIGVAAHAFRLTADLERARLRIVTAREETRRRLGGDLHDGVGHQLAGLARKAERVANLLERDPTAARTVLAEVTQQLNTAITQVRGLAHQLHPPELELLGLVGALRERAQMQSSFAIRVEAPDSLPPLPSAIETAAYYITLEALTNVEKHAGAKACHIHLTLADSDLPVLENRYH